MKIVRFAAALLLVPSPSILLAQTPSPAKQPASPASTQPLIVDVHSSPYRSAIYYSMNIGLKRYDMRDATLLDMITFAYDREDQAILGGPTWIDFDRFDVVARIDSLKPPIQDAPPPDPTKPPVNPYDQVRPVLQQVLRERFHLTYHTEDRPLPGYIATIAKDGPKFAEAKDPAATNGCQATQDQANQGLYTIACISETMSQFFSAFGIYPHPVIDHTGLKKSYDFAFKIDVAQLRTRDDYVRVFTDALSRQLGLTVTPGDVPQPAMVIDKVDHAPTADPPDIAKLIPPLPDLEFEVATIRPAADNEPEDQVRPTGTQITFSNFPLQQLLVNAWELPTGAMLGNAPPWINQVKYTIVVKLPPDVDGRAIFQNRDQLENMLQKLLIDRFQIKYHWGEQTQDGWVLLADTQKMKKADPNSRSSCAYGPAEGEKDMAPNGGPYDNESHCQNVTMTQFADVLQSLAKSEIKNHVKDKTGLTGSYDFTFYYSSTRKLRADSAAAVAAAKEAGSDASDPVAGMSIQDAFRKELGLRLEKQPGTYPALILDHIEKTPTEN